MENLAALPTPQNQNLSEYYDGRGSLDAIPHILKKKPGYLTNDQMKELEKINYNRFGEVMKSTLVVGDKPNQLSPRLAKLTQQNLESQQNIRLGPRPVGNAGRT
jgi:hypothetical protein